MQSFSAYECPDPDTGSNSYVSSEVYGPGPPYSRFTVGSTVSYECDEGHVYKSGDNSSECLFDQRKQRAYWSNRPLKCKRKLKISY